MKRGLNVSLVIIFFLSITFISASLNVALSDQGSNVRTKSTGELLSGGNLRVYIYDAATGGSEIYNELFNEAISNGTWNVMVGEGTSLPLEFGKQYWRDYDINGQDVDFTLYNGSSVERRMFFSPLGDIGGEDINQSTNIIVRGINATSGEFNGGWESGGVSIRAGNIFAQTGYFYNITGLNVSTLNINGSLIPQNFDNTFDLGSTASKWRDLWLGRNLNVSDTITAKIIRAYDWTNVTIDFSKVQNVPWISSTNVAFTNQTNTFTLNQNFSNNITFTTASARLCNATGSCYTLSELNASSESSSSSNGSGVPAGLIAGFNGACPVGWTQSAMANTTFEKGLIKAWVTFDGASCASGAGGDCTLNSSFNVRLVERSATSATGGKFNVSFINNFSNADYAVSGSAGSFNNVNPIHVEIRNIGSMATTGTIMIESVNDTDDSGGNSVDAPRISVMVVGNGGTNSTFCEKTSEDNSTSNSFWGSLGFDLFLQNATYDVGIGTSTPSYQLEINDNSTTGKSLNVSNVLFVNQTNQSAFIGWSSTMSQTRLTIFGGDLVLHSTSTTHPKIYIGNPSIAGETLRFSYDNSLSQAFIRAGGEPSGTFKNLYIDAGSVVFNSRSNGTVNFTTQPVVGGEFMPFTRLFHNWTQTPDGFSSGTAGSLPGNWTVPTGVYRVYYQITGGGGAGGNGSTTEGGGGGAGAGTAMGFLNVTPNTNISFNVGMGGIGRAIMGANGGETNITYDGVTINARRGGGGFQGTTSSSAIGCGQGGMINLCGTSGDSSYQSNHGGGGSSHFGGGEGGGPSTWAGGHSNLSQNCGAGGGGAGNLPTNGGTARGGSGAGGCIFIWY